MLRILNLGNIGYVFTHTRHLAIDGSTDLFHYLIDKSGNKIMQGISNISKEGVLSNVFEVTIQQQEVSTAIYILLEKIEFKSVEAPYLADAAKWTLPKDEIKLIKERLEFFNNELKSLGYEN